MNHISNLDELENAIRQLELQRDREWLELKDQFSGVLEELRPSNLIKNTVQDLITAPDLKNNLLNTALGVSSGFLAKRLLIGQSNHPIKRLLGVILETVVSNKVSNNSDGIKNIGRFLMDKLFDFGGKHNDHTHYSNGNGHHHGRHDANYDKDSYE